MKHIFIINPKSGKKNDTEKITNFLKENFSNLNYEIYVTKHQNDAINYVKERCSSKSEALRFYSCGGDGTLNEVVNGAVGFSDVEVTAYPCGSGNDFIKVFGKENHFLDLNKLIDGSVMPIDLLKVNGRYCVNICNLGFDATVAYNMTKFKKWPLVTGAGAYSLGIIYSFIFKMKNHCKVIMDDEVVYDGKMLLTALGNGVCCGGSYYCLPKASITDGIIDSVLVKSMPRFKFIKMVSHYKDGTYLDIPKYQEVAKYRKIKSLQMISKKPITYCLDGECFKASEINVSIEHNVINFVYPKNYNLN